MAEMPTTTSQESTINLDKFEFGVSTLTPEHKVALRRLAAAIARTMQRKKVVRGTIIVLGHTDQVGEVPDNALLGLKRAAHTIQELRSLLREEKGIQPINFVPKTAGELSPITTNRNKQGRARNRRVEIMISWVIPVMLKPKPKPKPKEKDQKTNLPKLLTKDCHEYAIFHEDFGKTWRLLEETYYKTRLAREGTGPIELAITDDSILKKFTKAARDGIIEKVKGPIDDKVLGKQNASKLSAITTHVTNLKMIKDDLENERLMGWRIKDLAKLREERNFVHRKLVAKLVAHNDGHSADLSNVWIDYFDKWEEIRRLQELCEISRGTLRRGPSLRPAPK